MNLPHSDLHVSQGRTLCPFRTPREPGLDALLRAVQPPRDVSAARPHQPLHPAVDAQEIQEASRASKPCSERGNAPRDSIPGGSRTGDGSPLPGGENGKSPVTGDCHAGILWEPGGEIPPGHPTTPRRHSYQPQPARSATPAKSWTRPRDPSPRHVGLCYTKPQVKTTESMPRAAPRAGTVRMRWPPVHPIHRQARIHHADSRCPGPAASQEETEGPPGAVRPLGRAGARNRGHRGLPRGQPPTGTTCNTPRTAHSGTSRLTKPGPKTASATYKIGAHPRPNVCPAPGEIIERLWM